MAKKRRSGKWYDLDGVYLDELHAHYVRARQRLGLPMLSRDEQIELGMELARIENKRLVAKGYSIAAFKL